jgi:uncharacterized protein (TIGR03067 family)
LEIGAPGSAWPWRDWPKSARSNTYAAKERSMNQRPRIALWCALAVFGVGALTASRVFGDDQDKMQGTWKVTFTGAGIIKAQSVIIEGNTFTLIEGANKEAVKFALDPATKTIDFFMIGGKKEKIYHGIYAFDDNKLKLCWAPAGEPRPDSFGVGKKDRRRYFILQK